MADAIDIIALQEAKDFLNLTTTVNDAELALFITAASAMWLKRGGPGATSPAYDEWYSGGGPTIALRHTPVIAITQIVEALTGTTSYILTQQDPGSGLTSAFGYSIVNERGLITRRANGVATEFMVGELNVHVTYTAGFVTAPEDVKLAIKLLVDHMWQTQRGGSKRPNSTDEYVPGVGFMWPHRVEQILGDYVLPGIA
jgi:hypothetical protein